MSKKTTLFLVLAGILALLSYLSYNVISKVKEKDRIAKRINKIPEFQFLSLNQQIFSNLDLKNGLITIFIYFNSECDLCQHEAQNISANLEEFKNVQFIFVSTEPITTIQQFSKKNNLSNNQNVMFLHDKSNTFSSLFDATSFPYILIYDQKQHLIKKHRGQLNAIGINRVLQQND